MKHTRLTASAIVTALSILMGCKESDREAPPPKPAAQTTGIPQAVATTRPSATTMPFATDPHSGMMMPPGHPPIGDAHGITTPPVAGKPLLFTAPAMWKSETPSSNMRVAQYRVPRAAGDSADGVVAVSTFAGMRGMTQMNVDRWIEQFGQPDSRPSKDSAKVTTMDVAGMKTTILRITGTYEGHAGWAMCAADIETPESAWFVKMTGPERTIKENDAAFEAFIKSASR